MTYNIKFHYVNEKGMNKELTINANSEETFEKIMNKFFSQANPIPTKNAVKFSVFYRCKLLNSGYYLQRTVKNIFKRDGNPDLNVLDINGIIGD